MEEWTQMHTYQFTNNATHLLPINLTAFCGEKTDHLQETHADMQAPQRLSYKTIPFLEKNNP